VVRLRNPLRPVNRLPPEILALCIAFIPRTNPKPIIPLTHVCRYWREVITSDPRSWALISSRWKRLAPLCLERAGAAPLTANISVPAIQDDKDFLQVLLPHVPRISHLSLTGYKSIKDVKDILPDFFASPMLDLTSLELEQHSNPTQSFPSNQVHPPPLFQNVANLKSLHLTRIPLYPMLFGIESLVELKLVGYKPPYQRFIEFLESNPHLEVVELDIEFSKTPVSTPQRKMVSLPRLRHLALTCDNATSARTLLSCLSFPRGVHIEVRGSRWNTYGDLPLLLSGPCTPVQDLLAPITTIKYLPYGLHLSGNGRSVSFLAPLRPQDIYRELDMFAIGGVREFHLPPIHHDRLSRPLGQLPALEALAIP